MELSGFGASWNTLGWQLWIWGEVFILYLLFSLFRGSELWASRLLRWNRWKHGVYISLGNLWPRRGLHWQFSWPDHHSDCSTSEFLISTRSHQPSFSSPSGTQPGFFCVLIFRPYKWVLLSWEAEPGLTFSGFLEWAIGFSCSLAPIFYLGSSLELSAQLQQRALRPLCLWVL